MRQELLITLDVQSAELLRCIDHCEHCHRKCLYAAMSYCLEQGGANVEPPHFRLMMACADLCRMTADSILSGSHIYEHLCLLCSRVCIECAESCERLGNMEQCVEACVTCSESCRQLCGLQPLASKDASDRAC
jgi:hypothetical protein